MWRLKTGLLSIFLKRMERQDQIGPCVEKGSHSKNTWIQHKPNKSLKRNVPQLQCIDHSFYQRCMILGSYMLWMIIRVTLTLSLVSCRRVFDLGVRKPNISKMKNDLHKKTWTFEGKSFWRGRARVIYARWSKTLSLYLFWSIFSRVGICVG